jgi:hypothetical protein
LLVNVRLRSEMGACARLRDSKDCAKLQFTRIFTRDFCFAA